MQPSDFGWNGVHGWFPIMIGVALFWLLMCEVPFLTQYVGHVVYALLIAVVVIFALIFTHM